MVVLYACTFAAGLLIGKFGEDKNNKMGCGPSKAGDQGPDEIIAMIENSRKKNPDNLMAKHFDKVRKGGEIYLRGMRGTRWPNVQRFVPRMGSYGRFARICYR